MKEEWEGGPGGHDSVIAISVDRRAVNSRQNHYRLVVALCWLDQAGKT